MFIHIGGDTMVKLRDVVGIFDIEVQKSPLAKVGERGSVSIFDPNQPEIKSIVVTTDRVYFSPISSLTLGKRAQVQRNMVD